MFALGRSVIREFLTNKFRTPLIIPKRGPHARVPDYAYKNKSEKVVVQGCGEGKDEGKNNDLIKYQFETLNSISVQLAILL